MAIKTEGNEYRSPYTGEDLDSMLFEYLSGEFGGSKHRASQILYNNNQGSLAVDVELLGDKFTPGLYAVTSFFNPDDTHLGVSPTDKSSAITHFDGVNTSMIYITDVKVYTSGTGHTNIRPLEKKIYSTNLEFDGAKFTAHVDYINVVSGQGEENLPSRITRIIKVSSM